MVRFTRDHLASWNPIVHLLQVLALPANLSKQRFSFKGLRSVCPARWGAAGQIGERQEEEPAHSTFRKWRIARQAAHLAPGPMPGTPRNARRARKNARDARGRALLIKMTFHRPARPLQPALVRWVPCHLAYRGSLRRRVVRRTGRLSVLGAPTRRVANMSRPLFLIRSNLSILCIGLAALTSCSVDNRNLSSGAGGLWRRRRALLRAGHAVRRRADLQRTVAAGRAARRDNPAGLEPRRAPPEALATG